jgi:hypothetical protein
MLPNLIIIGAMKCWTSALHHYLDQHPDIAMSQQKELDFFIAGRNWEKGLAWYTSMVPDTATIRGESSPDYTHYPAIPGVPEKMYAVVPGAKLIYMVRDPLERMLSQYMHNRWTGIETRPFAEAIQGKDVGGMEHTRYIRRSKYFMQIEQYLPYYAKPNIMVLTQEDLFKRRLETLQKVFRFLGVREDFESERFNTLVHESSGKDTKNRLGLALAKGRERGLLSRLPAVVRRPAERVVRSMTTTTVQRPTLDDKLRNQILEVLAPDLEMFERFAGRKIAHWGG